MVDTVPRMAVGMIGMPMVELMMRVFASASDPIVCFNVVATV